MRRKITLLVFMLLVSFALTSCFNFNLGNTECSHEDNDSDGKCDKCTENMENAAGDVECTEHEDRDLNYKCDECGIDMEKEYDSCVSHKDSDLDGECDNCGDFVEVDYDGTLVLIDNGVPTFQFVIGGKIGACRTPLNQLVNDINKCLENASVTAVSEQSSSQKPIEILVGGVTNRGERYVKDAYYLGYNGYAIEIIDSKILLLAGSEQALEKAIITLGERVFGINDEYDRINNVRITESIDARQTEFDIEKISISGRSVEDYVIATDLGNIYTYSVAKNIRETIYKKTGKYLDIVNTAHADGDTPKISLDVIPLAQSGTVGGGFSVYVNSNGNLNIECEFPNKLASSVETFLADIFGEESAVGKEIIMSAGTVDIQNIRNISYADFGAVGDGITDDSDAIRRTHEYANTWGHTVVAEAAQTYRIGKIEESIPVKTDTDWNGATIVLDDSEISWDDKDARSVWVFKVMSSSSYNGKSVNVPSGMTLSKGQANIGLTFDSPCMLKIENSDENERIYIRYGTNANSGDYLHEFIIVDEYGNVDSSTPITYDYSTVTSIVRYSISDRPIFIGNGTVKTIAPNPKESDPSYENNYCYFNRGIHVSRSNTTLYGINYIVEGEDMTVRIDRDGDGNIDFWGTDKSYGVPYRGTFNFNECYNCQFIDSTLEAHQAYSFWQTSGGKEVRNEMGSYAITANSCIEFAMRSLTQYENSETGETITNREMYHGIMSSNYCRNMLLEQCYLDRFDAHKGLYNASLTDSTFGFGILAIGGGELYVENVTRISGDPFIMLRNDYNSIFDGDVIIKNCIAGSAIKSVFAGNWVQHDAGLPNYMVRNITIDGFVAEANALYIFNIKNASAAALTDTVNPLYLPSSIVVSNIYGSDGVTEITPIASKNNDVFKSLTIEYK